VVDPQQALPFGARPDPEEGVAESSLPVDQRPIAVERRPAVGHRPPTIFAPIEIAPGHPDVARIVAPNPGPMTLAGTNTYLVGADPAYVIDPGPADEGHIARLHAAAEARGGLGGVVLTHSHADHSAGVEMLGAALLWGSMSEGVEWDEQVAGSGCQAEPAPARFDRIGPFEVIPTPGHAVDHVAFAYGPVCFCGDLVLGEGSSIVLPDGGGLAAYLESLRRLAERGFEALCPGHGPWIGDPSAKLASYREHRLERERLLVAALARGERSRERLLDAAWADVPAPMRPAAAIAMQAHLDKLEAEGGLPPDLTS
jgi:glyoxylase-like metal-dependent hydrolase (beta-lactamase superfamily II)